MNQNVLDLKTFMTQNISHTFIHYSFFKKIVFISMLDANDNTKFKSEEKIQQRGGVSIKKTYKFAKNSQLGFAPHLDNS